jgi:hypothetical protein
MSIYYFLHIHPSSPFPYILPTPTEPTPRQNVSSVFWKKTFLFKGVSWWHFHAYIYIYIYIIARIVHLLYFSSTLVPFLWWFQQV